MAANADPTTTNAGGMGEETNPDSVVGTFQTLSAEGDLLAQRGSFQEAIEVFTRALTLRPGDKHCLVSRSKCHIQVGSPRLALVDADLSLKGDPTFFKGLFQKAEALYAQGDFELALMYYHRGNRLRPELHEFRIGIQKSREAIENSIGNPKEFKIRVPTKLRKNIASYLTENPLQAAASSPPGTRSGLKPSNALTRESTFVPTVKHQTTHTATNPIKASMEAKLLGELYDDKLYLQNLMSDKDFVDHPDQEIIGLVNEGLRYLETRLEFWRQQNPLYARPKERKIRPRGVEKRGTLVKTAPAAEKQQASASAGKDSKATHDATNDSTAKLKSGTGTRTGSPVKEARSMSITAYYTAAHVKVPQVKSVEGAVTAASAESHGALINSSDLPITDETAHHHGSSVSEAVYHIICVIAGSGVLQLPFALNQSGWIGVLIILFAAIANGYSGRLLVKCLYANGVGAERLGGFPHVGLKAFGPRGKAMVEMFNSAMLIGVPIVYLILSGMNLEILVGYFSLRVWIVISALVVLIPFLIFRTLKEIAIFSAFGVFATIVVIFTVVFYSLSDLPVNSGKVTHKLIDFAQFPSALGSISFSYAGNFVYPEVESSMSNPSQFPLVLTISMTVISLMYLVTAVVGYAAYGNTTVSPILNNLPAGFVSKFAIAVITAHVLLAIPVLVTTFSLEMERRLKISQPGRSEKVEGVSRAVLRIVILTGITVLAMAVPFFADFMTLLGAVANTALIFVFPVLFDFKLFGFSKRPVKDKLFGLVILAVGLFGGIVGGKDAVIALIMDFRGEGSAGRGGH
ncbi:Tetratricopeptide repeat protein 25 [Chytridiales sp. JEL 0842]|nr:Tetratricopeptide repeat protein 25 [Chytridiales sp. JEL 0842]